MIVLSLSNSSISRIQSDDKCEVIKLSELAGRARCVKDQLRKPITLFNITGGVWEFQELQSSSCSRNHAAKTSSTSFTGMMIAIKKSSISVLSIS